jgi:hypothetical protein
MATTPAAVAPPECLACAATRATWIIPRGRRPARVSNSIKKAGAISAPKWSREFEYPLVLADSRKLVTLRDAATYITKLWYYGANATRILSGNRHISLITGDDHGKTTNTRPLPARWQLKQAAT